MIKALYVWQNEVYLQAYKPYETKLCSIGGILLFSLDCQSIVLHCCCEALLLVKSGLGYYFCVASVMASKPFPYNLVLRGWNLFWRELRQLPHCPFDDWLVVGNLRPNCSSLLACMSSLLLEQTWLNFWVWTFWLHMTVWKHWIGSLTWGLGSKVVFLLLVSQIFCSGKKGQLKVNLLILVGS